MKKIITPLLVVLFMGAGALAILLWHPPQVLQQWVIDGVVAQVRKKTLYELNIDGVHGGLFSGFVFKKVSCRDTLEKTNGFKAESIFVSVRWKALWHRRVELKSLVLVKPQVEWTWPFSGEAFSLEGVPLKINQWEIQNGQFILHHQSLSVAPLVMKQVQARGYLKCDEFIVERGTAAVSEGTIILSGEGRLSSSKSGRFKFQMHRVALHSLAGFFTSIPAPLFLSYSGQGATQFSAQGWQVEMDGDLNGGRFSGTVNQNAQKFTVSAHLNQIPVKRTWRHSALGDQGVLSGQCDIQGKVGQWRSSHASGRFSLSGRDGGGAWGLHRPQIISTVNLQGGRGTMDVKLSADQMESGVLVLVNIPEKTLNAQFHVAAKNIQDLRPWVKTVEGWQGALVATGTVDGSWFAPSINSQIQLSGLDGTSVSVSSALVHLEKKKGNENPLHLFLQVEGMAWKTESLQRWNMSVLTLSAQGKNSVFQTQANAWLQDKAEIHFEGPVTSKETGWSVTWNQLELVPAEGTSFTFQKGGSLDLKTDHSVELQDVHVEQGKGHFHLKKFLWGSDQVHVDAVANQVSIKPVLIMLGYSMDVDGVAGGQLFLDGLRREPEGKGIITVSSFSIDGFQIPRAQVKAHMAAPWLMIDTVTLNTIEVDESLQGHGRLPWHWMEARSPDLPMDMTLSSPMMDPRLLAAAWPRAEVAPGGHFSFQGHITGRLPHIDLEGSLVGSFPRVAIPSWGVDLRDGDIDIQAHQRGFSIRRCEAKLGKGTIVLTGQSDWPSLQVDLAAQGVTINIPKQLVMKADADLQLRGNFSQPVLTGAVHLGESTYSVLKKKKSSEQGEENTVLPTIVKNSVMDVAVEWSHGVWYRDGLTKIETKADLHVHKDAGVENIYLSGPLDLVRGTYDAYGRDFVVSRGQLLFTGPPDINPDLNIQAQYKTKDVTVDLDVTGTAEKPLLHPTSSPPMTEQEIYTLLATGRSPASSSTSGSSAADSNQGAELAADVVSSYLTKELRSAGMNVLNLDVIRVTPGDNGSVWTLGRYWGSKLFISYSQNPNDSGSSVINAEYTFKPNWSLIGQSGSRSDNYMDLQFRVPLKQKKKK